MICGFISYVLVLSCFSFCNESFVTGPSKRLVLREYLNELSCDVWALIVSLKRYARIEWASSYN
jgi:hypothetical protein